MMGLVKKIINLLLALCALPFVLLIRLLRPIVTIRIVVLDSGRVGGILQHFDIYVRNRDAHLIDTRCFDIFCFREGKVANKQVKKMVARSVPIIPFAFWVDKLNRRLSGWERHTVSIKSGRSGIYLDSNSTLPLTFNASELKYGREELKKLGLMPNQTFVCFHAREASYLSTHQPNTDWDYHSYRNADINNYVPAVEGLAKKGYTAIRMGRHVSGAVKTNKSGIIDYAARGGTDFLDMYLSAHCQFFIAGSDGLAEMPTVFRRPVIWIDFIPFKSINLVAAGQLVIPKKLKVSKENRFLTFDEMLNSQVAQFSRTEHYDKAGIEVINSTPEEIRDVSMEMEERLKGTWKETQEDKQLQEQFRNLVEKKIKVKFYGFLGAQFLRQNKELLDESFQKQTVKIS